MEKKNPLIGGLLNLLIPGLGYIYIGKWLQGIGYLILWPIASGIMFSLAFLINDTDPPWPDFICYGLVGIFVLIVLYSDGRRAVVKFNQGLSKRLCPFCAEPIQEKAIVCKHCGRELEGTDIVLGKPDIEVEEEKKLQRNRIIALVMLAAFLFVTCTGLVSVLISTGKLTEIIKPFEFAKPLIPTATPTQVAISVDFEDYFSNQKGFGGQRISIEGKLDVPWGFSNCPKKTDGYYYCPINLYALEGYDNVNVEIRLGEPTNSVSRDNDFRSDSGGLIPEEAK